VCARARHVGPPDHAAAAAVQLCNPKRSLVGRADNRSAAHAIDKRTHDYAGRPVRGRVYALCAKTKCTRVGVLTRRQKTCDPEKKTLAENCEEKKKAIDKTILEHVVALTCPEITPRKTGIDFRKIIALFRTVFRGSFKIR